MYSFSHTHLELLQELDRLFPHSTSVVEFDDILPGVESIETVSLRLLERFLREREQQVFLVFCRINAERLLDAIDAEFDRHALPLDRDEVLSEAYARLFHDGHTESSSRLLLRRLTTAEPMHREPAPVWRILVERVGQVIREQRRDLESMQLPLPGLPLPVTVVGQAADDIGLKILGEHEVSLEEEELRRWLTFSLMRLQIDLRRAFLLREVAGLELGEVAERMAITPFEAARFVRSAHRDLASHVRWLVDVFVHGTSPDAGSENTSNRDSDPPSLGEEEADDD